MRAMSSKHGRRFVTGLATASILALSLLGGTASAANSRAFTVSVTNPTNASQGANTKFDVNVESQDNQTIANVQLSIPSTTGPAWPAGYQIVNIFGPNGAACPGFTATSATCNFGNIAALGSRQITVLVKVPANAASGATFSASAMTNNENGTNLQIVSNTSAALNVVAASANGVTTANLNGLVSTADLGTTNAGNLSTTLNLIGDNTGKGNVVVIQEGSSTTQPAVCVSLKLTCQPDFVDLTVNSGSVVTPYLETVLTAKVPSSYNIKKAFVIHVLADGTTLDQGFPLYNTPTTSCSANPAPLPCADFSITKDGILTIKVHTKSNGGMKY
jgi:hypothetical protein